jgi:hypothetical protein
LLWELVSIFLLIYHPHHLTSKNRDPIAGIKSP